jgi:dephospho-CoA kinase
VLSARPGQSLTVDSTVPALFLTGGPGSGKTALAHEISELLWQLDEPHVVIDLDELGRGVIPGGSDDFNLSLTIDNMKAVWENFRAAGVRRLVLARVVRTSAELQRLVDAIPDCDVSVWHVAASDEVVAARIARREAGSARDFLLKVARDLNADSTGLLGTKVLNDGAASITDMARSVLTQAHWPCP